MSHYHDPGDLKLLTELNSPVLNFGLAAALTASEQGDNRADPCNSVNPLARALGRRRMGCVSVCHYANRFLPRTYGDPDTSLHPDEPVTTLRAKPWTPI
jgi:hypothetical protein